jgi:hypothetical protein
VPREAFNPMKNAMAKNDARYPAHCDVLFIREFAAQQLINLSSIGQVRCCPRWSKA